MSLLEFVQLPTVSTQHSLYTNISPHLEMPRFVTDDLQKPQKHRRFNFSMFDILKSRKHKGKSFHCPEWYLLPPLPIKLHIPLYILTCTSLPRVFRLSRLTRDKQKRRTQSIIVYENRLRSEELQ